MKAQLTLGPNSTSERKMRRPSKSSENALPPLTLNVPAKFGQIKVLVPQIPALPQSVVVHYHLLCQCASSAAPCRQERRGRGFGDQSARRRAASAPGEGQAQSDSQLHYIQHIRDWVTESSTCTSRHWTMCAGGGIEYIHFSSHSCHSR